MKKNVLITGAGGNLGTEVVKRFINEGYHVIAMVSPGKSLKSVEHHLDFVEVDLTQEAEVNKVISGLISKYSVIDAAVLLVGGFEAGGFDVADGASIRRMYALNFETAYFVARPILLHMLTQSAGGRIIFVGSRPSLESKAGKNLVSYALSKSLLFTLSDFINASAVGSNVASAVVVPATIDTPANRKAMPQADFTTWVTPDAIAEVILFASSTSSPLRESVLKVYGRG